jgi:hypothetical protein
MDALSKCSMTGNKVVTIKKMKSAEFARADAGGIFERKASCPERSGSIHHLGAA